MPLVSAHNRRLARLVGIRARAGAATWRTVPRECVNIRSFSSGGYSIHLRGYSMIRITWAMIGVAVACVCWNAGEAVARDIKISPLLDNLAMFTGTYISQARACKTDEWKPALRESIIQVRKREPASD